MCKQSWGAGGSFIFRAGNGTCGVRFTPLRFCLAKGRAARSGACVSRSLALTWVAAFPWKAQSEASGAGEDKVLLVRSRAPENGLEALRHQAPLVLLRAR